MNAISDGIVFGPVPSRRLGKSLGINTIPPKTCSYSCAYCQIGYTNTLQMKREVFYDPKKLCDQVEKKIQYCHQHGEQIDYLTLVSDGEPTLDLNLNELIKGLKVYGYPVAVISNASLLSDETVRRDLMVADWVSMKIDTVQKETWKKINRPYKGLNLVEILEGIIIFSKEFSKTFVTETMIVKNINDNDEEFEKISSFIKLLHPKTSYLSIPIRPPAASWVTPPSEHTLINAFQRFSEKGISVEYLIGYEGNQFAFTGDIQHDILSITSVHPLRKEALEQLLKKAGKDWSVVEALIQQKLVIKHTFNNKVFFIRNIHLRDTL